MECRTQKYNPEFRITRGIICEQGTSIFNIRNILVVAFFEMLSVIMVQDHHIASIYLIINDVFIPKFQLMITLSLTLSITLISIFS